MGILGKLLAVLNVLAAVAFVYLAAADWGRHQAWSYATARYDVAIHGLPVDADERDPEDGSKLVERFDDKALAEIFGPAGGNPVATQQQAVEKTRENLKGLITGNANDKATRQTLAVVLLPLTTSTSEREALTVKIFGDPARKIKADKVDDLMGDQGPFAAAFADPLAKKEAAEKAAAIAHLLLNLGHPNAKPVDWQKWVVVVVGVRAYAAAAADQALALRRMTDDVQATRAQDRSTFEEKNYALLKVLQVLAEEVAARQQLLDNYRLQTGEHEAQVTARTKERDALKRQLDVARAAMADALQQQRRQEQRLFQDQRTVRDAQHDNEVLERRLEKLENVGP